MKFVDDIHAARRNRPPTTLANPVGDATQHGNACSETRRGASRARWRDASCPGRERIRSPELKSWIQTAAVCGSGWQGSGDANRQPGCAVAAVSIRPIIANLSFDLPRAAEIRGSWPILAFGIGLSVVVGALVGVGLTVTGLFVRSLGELNRAEPGFDAASIVTVNASTPEAPQPLLGRECCLVMLLGCDLPCHNRGTLCPPGRRNLIASAHCLLSELRWTTTGALPLKCPGSGVT